jgi:hypothetical protein
MTHTFLKRPLLLSTLRAFSPGMVQAEQAMTQGQTRYEALQSISYGFGSKFTSGYFTVQSGRCSLNPMVIEKSPQDQLLPVTAARVRLTLNPGQVAGLDSEEGESLSFTCGMGATALLVDTGPKDKLVALQKGSMQDRVGVGYLSVTASFLKHQQTAL